jgi:BlaI family transcriptional regulator, penicillinase repressor
VMTTVRILEEKGFVEKCGKQARAFVYRSLVAQSAVRGSMVRDLAHRLFDGSVKSLVLNLIEDRELKAEELSEVKAIIQRLESRK